VPVEDPLRRPAIYSLIKFSRATGMFPASLSIGHDLEYESTVDAYNVDGGMADVFQAVYRGKTLVAVKRPRRLTEGEKMVRTPTYH
jgi:hypothetical protein